MDLNGTALEQADIATISAELLTGRVSARQLVDAYLARIEALDHQGPELNAMVTLNPAAREHADEVDRALAESGRSVGPLHGIPMVVKDCLETADMPTSFGSEIFADYRPDADATVVARLRAAGAVIVAKTTLPDWATSWFSYSSRTGVTKNPYDLERDPGGSSSGTGAADRGRVRHRGSRHRLRRIGPVAVLVLQPGRRAVHAGPDQPRRLQPAGQRAGHHRADDQVRRGRRAGVHGHGRFRRDGSR